MLDDPVAAQRLAESDWRPREAKLGVTVLRDDQAALIANQRPMLNQVTKLKRRAFHKRLSSRWPSPSIHPYRQAHLK